MADVMARQSAGHAMLEAAGEPMARAQQEKGPVAPERPGQCPLRLECTTWGAASILRFRLG